MFEFNRAGIAGITAGLLLVSTPVLAETEYGWAKVTSAYPVYEAVTVVEPYEECREERVPYTTDHASSTPPILGAIIGGALGNAVGHKKRNKQVGVAVGALLGGSIGADIARNANRRVSYQTATHCEVVEQTRREERLAGYDVTYEYKGVSYRTRMRSDPGENVRVRVQVTPVG